MENNGLVAKLLAWGPAIIILIALLTGMVLNSNVDSVAEDSTEMVQTSVYLDSPTSLRTIIVTLNRQYVRAEEQWMQALSTSTFLLFLVSVMALAMWGRLLHLRRQQQENQAKQNKKGEP
ncbi:MAG: hypothetical protein V7739_15725 [Motiliproteus sp.]